MAPYITDLAAVKRVLMSGGVYPRIKIGNASTDNITEAQITAFIDAQESYISGRLGFTPSATIEAILKEAATYLSCYNIYSAVIIRSEGDEIPANVVVWGESGEKWIDDMLAGRIQIQPGKWGVKPTTKPRSSGFRQIREEEVYMTDQDYLSLDHQHVLKFTEVVYDDLDKTNVYVRDTDYEIFYDTGEIRRLSGGNITDKQTVYVDYFYRPKLHHEPTLPSVEWESGEYGDV